MQVANDVLKSLKDFDKALLYCLLPDSCVCAKYGFLTIFLLFLLCIKDFHCFLCTHCLNQLCACLLVKISCVFASGTDMGLCQYLIFQNQ